MATQLKAIGSCDFCPNECNADTPGAKAYECRDFRMSSGVISTGAWGACPACATLIDAEDWDSQLEYMVAAQIKALGPICWHRQGLRDACKSNLDGFRKNRV
jgi:hypothetical protein